MGRILPILLGTLIGLVLIGTIASSLTTRRGLAEATPDQAYPDMDNIDVTEVVVALHSIPQGSVFFPGSIARRGWPVGNVPPGTVGDEAETIGKVAQTDIVKGQIIVREMLADLGQDDQYKVENVITTVEVEKEVEVEKIVTVEVEEAVRVDQNQSALSVAAQAQANRMIIYTGHIWLVVKETEEAIVARVCK